MSQVVDLVFHEISGLADLVAVFAAGLLVDETSSLFDRLVNGLAMLGHLLTDVVEDCLLVRVPDAP